MGEKKKREKFVFEKEERIESDVTIERATSLPFVSQASANPTKSILLKNLN